MIADAGEKIVDPSAQRVNRFGQGDNGAIAVRFGMVSEDFHLAVGRGKNRIRNMKRVKPLIRIGKGGFKAALHVFGSGNDFEIEGLGHVLRERKLRHESRKRMRQAVGVGRQVFGRDLINPFEANGRTLGNQAAVEDTRGEFGE